MNLDNITNASLRSKLQLYLIQNLKCLQDCNINQLKELLETIEFLIGLSATNDKFRSQFDLYSNDSIRNEFKQTFYSICLKEILVNFNQTKLSIATSSQEIKQIKSMVINIISITNFTDSFSIIYDLCVSK